MKIPLRRKWLPQIGRKPAQGKAEKQIEKPPLTKKANDKNYKV